MKTQFLAKVGLFKRLPSDQLPLLASACVEQNFKVNEAIIKQGDQGIEFFIIMTGDAKVMAHLIFHNRSLCRLTNTTGVSQKLRRIR
jgi:CRP-like cAMP-binding protein